MSWLPDWVTGFDREAYEAGLEADKRNAEITEGLRERGRMSEEDYQVASEHYADAAAYDPDKAINEATAEGFQDGIRNVRGTLGDILSVPFKLIPPIGWVIIAGVAFWYMGGALFLKGSLKRFK